MYENSVRRRPSNIIKITFQSALELICLAKYLCLSYLTLQIEYAMLQLAAISDRSLFCYVRQLLLLLLLLHFAFSPLSSLHPKQTPKEGARGFCSSPKDQVEPKTGRVGGIGGGPQPQLSERRRHKLIIN